MPPKTRGSKVSKPTKENVSPIGKLNSKILGKMTKLKRKALTDKTNSTSDDNATLLSSKVSTNGRTVSETCVVKCFSTDDKLVKGRSLRERKVPKRFIEDQVFSIYKKVKDTSEETQHSVVLDTNSVKKIHKVPIVVLNAHISDKKTKVADSHPRRICHKPTITKKTQVIIQESTIADSRPRRICRLPSKFDDHSISPNKFIAVQPIQASTPITQNKESKLSKMTQKKSPINLQKETKSKDKVSLKKTNIEKVDFENNNLSVEKDVSSTQKYTRKVQKRKCDVHQSKNIKKNITLKEIDKSLQLNKGKRYLEKDYSFRLFDENKKTLKRDTSNLDIYEFTYDPNEEPPPQKKKRKNVTKKRQNKPKTVNFFNIYDKNVAKSLANLSRMLSKKSSQSKDKKVQLASTTVNKQNNEVVNTKEIISIDQQNMKIELNKKEVFEKNNNFPVNDCNALVMNDHDEMNYSPVNSPRHRMPSDTQNDGDQNLEVTPFNKDPLNLQDDISFFDELPAASSSINTSVRHPSATPWRVEFDQLPIKWQVNAYVKPNMTPAIETSFVKFADNKKHVYINMVPEKNDSLPEIHENSNRSNLKQTSIISFIKEVVEKNEHKKSKLKSTPTKSNSVFEDLTNTSINVSNAVTPTKQNTSEILTKSITPKKNKSSDNITSSSENMSGEDKENSGESINNKKHGKKTNLSKKKKNKDITYFGFDESEDQENLSPLKKQTNQIKSLKPCARVILQDLNEQTRNVKDLSSAPATQKIFQNADKDNSLQVITQASDEPVSKKKDIGRNTATNPNDVTTDINLSQEDSQSVHLFEDIEVVHHNKPIRKSYGKSKAVTFRQHSFSSDSQSNNMVENDESSEEDNLDDLTFQVPSVQPKRTKRKKKTKQKLSKKEKKEADAWAAGFNSMCEEVDEFNLVVE